MKKRACTMRLSSKKTEHVIISTDLKKIILQLQKELNSQLKLKKSKKRASFVWASHKLAAKLRILGGIVK